MSLTAGMRLGVYEVVALLGAGATELRIARAIHLSHRARPQQSANFIRTESGSCSETHRSVRPKALGSGFETTFLALSPDGGQLAFVATDRLIGSRIWIRPLAAIGARGIAGTEGATSAFWSPDGKSLAFFSGDKLKRVDLAGGAAVSLCDVQQGISKYGTWGQDGQILFATVEGKEIWRVSTAGGAPVAVVKPDQSRGETRVSWPWFLPDGRSFLYLARHRDAGG